MQILRYSSAIQKQIKSKIDAQPWLHIGVSGDKYAIWVWDTRQIVEVGKVTGKVVGKPANDNHQPLVGKGADMFKFGNEELVPIRLTPADFSVKTERDTDEPVKAGERVLYSYSTQNDFEFYDDKSDNKRRSATPSIDEYYASGHHDKVGGYDIYFDEAGPVGSCRTFNEAVKALEDWINALRKKGHGKRQWIYNQSKGDYQLNYKMS